jgi:hypothetical protein
MIRSAKAFVFLTILGISGAVAATAAHAQSATSCPGGTDKNASDCLQVSLNGSQVSLIQINEQDELDNPGTMWHISGLVATNPAFLGKWIGLIEPGADLISDLVGVPTDGTLAFIADPVDLTGFTIASTFAETASPLDVSFLLGLDAASAGFTVSFQSDLNAVPEPSTWAMLLLGFAGLGCIGYRKVRPTRALAA